MGKSIAPLDSTYPLYPNPLKLPPPSTSAAATGANVMMNPVPKSARSRSINLTMPARDMGSSTSRSIPSRR